MTVRLKTYRTKRRFDVTEEPRGKISYKRGRAFVVQKHSATRLHYDMRLELDGVMKSWAVTRGPSLVPGEKRLAVAVEDHPVEYNKFEGTIPEGEYGAGTVMIWDRGTWQAENDPHKGLEKGHLSFKLEGEKLHGGWHLVRMRRRTREKRNNWLLIKQHDAAERGLRDPDILEQMPLSVATGRTLDEIAEGVSINKKKSAENRNAKRKDEPVTRKRTQSAVRKSVRKKSKADNDDPLSTAPKAALPVFVPPCLATLADKPPQGDAWLHEIKYDGYRLEARLSNGKVQLLTRRGLNWTQKFPAIAAALAKFPAKTALIDGEVVVEDNNGVSSFSLLQQALKTSDDRRMIFYAFDLMHLNGLDLRSLPLSARKDALAQLLASAPRGPLRFSESILEHGPTLFAKACEIGLEGIVSKRMDAAYRSGRGREWIKSKCSDRQEFVVAGFVPSTVDARAIGALVLGVNDKGKLRYAGRTGTGFSHDAARTLYRKLSAIAVKASPFTPVPKEERGARGPIWVEPKTVVEIDFRGWTHGDRVRQASFQGVREDKAASEVVREVKVVAAANKEATAIRRSTPLSPRNRAHHPKAASGHKADDIVGAVKLTHPDRIYWKDEKITKRNLADYYAHVWPWMKPHVVRRPIALVRCPEGTNMGHCFFQKHATGGVAAEYLHLVEEKGSKIISIDDLDGLISLVQAGALEIHTRGTTIDHREEADRLVFDLDPGPGANWKDVVRAARDVRERLEGIKLKTFIKTSGSKGLHVVLPIEPTPWDEAKAFARAVAEVMEADIPTRYVASAAKAKRHGRIFIDYLRNSRESTAVAPYSTRARLGAPVSTPVAWAELSSLKSADQYTLNNITHRLTGLHNDPWAQIGLLKQTLPSFKK